MGNFSSSKSKEETIFELHKAEFINPIQFDTQYGECIICFNPNMPLKEHYIQHSKTHFDPAIQLNIEQFNDISLFIKNKLNDNSNNFCNDLTLSYVEEKLENNSGILVIKKKQKLFGFAIFVIYNDEIYIEIICTHKKYKGYGTYMIHIIEYLCQIYNIHTLTLDSVDTALSFYTRLGFTPIQNIIALEKNITPKNQPFQAKIKRKSNFSPSNSSFLSVNTLKTNKISSPHLSNKTNKISSPHLSNKSSVKRKRCRKGTRKNPKTLLCEKYIKTMTPHSIHQSIQSKQNTFLSPNP